VGGDDRPEDRRAEEPDDLDRLDHRCGEAGWQRGRSRQHHDHQPRQHHRQRDRAQPPGEPDGGAPAHAATLVGAVREVTDRLLRRARAHGTALRLLLQRQPLSAVRRSASTRDPRRTTSNRPETPTSCVTASGSRSLYNSRRWRRGGSRLGAGPFGQACAGAGLRLLRSTPMATTQKTSMTVSPAASATAGPCPSTSDQAFPEAWNNTVSRMLPPDPL
jgi:hypothetical protein